MLPMETHSLIINHGHGVIPMRMESFFYDIKYLDCKIAFEDDIYTTAAAPSSYKYWKVMEDDDDIVVTNNTALVFDPLLVIPGGTTATTNYTAIDVGEDAFNTRFRASYEYIIRREC
eukprot:560510_1